MKTIIYDNEAKEQLLAGINKLARAVTSTLGPQGRNVLINLDSSSVSHITKDGVTVANSIELSDPIENLGAMLLKEVAKKTVKEAGDGTTTSIVLANAMITDCLKSIPDTMNIREVKAGMEYAVEFVKKYLKEHSLKITTDVDLFNVATISANNDVEIGKLIQSLGLNMLKNGAVTIEASSTSTSYTKVIEGLELHSGYVSPHFINTDSEEVVFEHPKILLFEKGVANAKELSNVLQNCLDTGTPLLIMGESIDDDTLGTLVINKVRTGLKVAVIKTPGFGNHRASILEDTALITGSTVVSNTTGVTIKTPNILGTCSKVIINKDSTIILNNTAKPDGVLQKIASLEELLKTPNLDTYVKNSYENSLSRLSGGVGIIYVGGNSEVEVKEKIDRYEDALCAVKAALEEGVIPGGGSLYIRAANELTEHIMDTNTAYNAGILIIVDAIQAPFNTLLSHNVQDSSTFHKYYYKLLSELSPMGYNFKTFELENLWEAGVIDPTKVARVALENAASIATMLLTTNCIVVNNQEDITKLLK